MLYFYKMSIENKRKLNEKKFPNWKELPNGSRRYWLEVKGKPQKPHKFSDSIIQNLKPETEGMKLTIETARDRVFLKRDCQISRPDTNDFSKVIKQQPLSESMIEKGHFPY